MRYRQIASWLGFQGVWLACGLGAASGRSWPALAAALLFSTAILATSPARKAHAGLALAGGFAGAVIESLLVASGLIRYSAPWPSEMLAPSWIIALWVAFGMTVPSMIAVLGTHRVAMAAALGAMAGPLSYVAGERLGALQIASPAWLGLMVLAVVWAAVCSGLVAMATRGKDELQPAAE